MKKQKEIPKFRDEDEEREFWAKNSVLDYFDSSKAAFVRFPNLKPTTQSISLRIPTFMINDLKVLANRKDVPYQSLIKIFLEEKIREELKKVG
ncbi:MAG TPA: BrnA antitoxin family protein [Ignavibacteriales bacterium]|nr:BrnA antitoxin family protein [Ignavibacteriales bacterium]